MMTASSRISESLIWATIVSLIIMVTCGDTETSDGDNVTPPNIIPSFFDFKKEIESIFPPNESHLSQSSKEFVTFDDYELEPGVTLERDYDFYDDDQDDFNDLNDVDMSESAQVTVRSGFYPNQAATR